MLFVFFISLVVGFSGAVLIEKYGFKLGIIDVPNERSSHSDLIPKGGGLGVLVSFIIVCLILNISKFLWFPAIFLSLVSFFGDRTEINPKNRLYIQFCCTLVFLFGTFLTMKLSPFNYLLIFPLSVFIVGSTNFYNFMDGINGMAGITAVISFCFLAWFGIWANVESKYVVLCFSIAFSCLGFLPLNIPSAKVFLGDIGSILLGFIFASLTVIFSKNIFDFFCLTGFLFPFYADELSTMLVRFSNGENLSKPHRKHLYQILANEYGIDHWKISVLYGFIQVFIALISFYLRQVYPELIFPFLLFSYFLFFIVFFGCNFQLKKLSK